MGLDNSIVQGYWQPRWADSHLLLFYIYQMKRHRPAVTVVITAPCLGY